MTTAAVTGHRPATLGGDYELRSPVWQWVRTHAIAAFERFDVDRLNNGLALGVDQLLAQAALDSGVAFHAFVPFEGQHLRWPRQSQRRYEQLRALADEVTVVSPGGYAAWKMHARNEAMVDTADLLIAVWNGETKGGTAACVAYAQRVDVPVWHLDPVARRVVGWVGQARLPG